MKRAFSIVKNNEKHCVNRIMHMHYIREEVNWDRRTVSAKLGKWQHQEEHVSYLESKRVE